jgi:hypothetical protein
MKVIPYTIVWGGKLKSDAAMYKFEFASLVIVVIFLMVILVKAQILKWRIPLFTVNHALWTMLAMFMINGFANLLSDNYLEKIIFIPITLLLSALLLIVILKKK